jgi:hypothetical protein
MNRKTIYAVSFALIVGIGAFFMWYQYAKANPCVDQQELGAAIKCYNVHMRELYGKGGVQEALSFAANRLFKDSTWAVTHLVMHGIGQEAYRETGSMAAAFKLLPKNGVTDLFDTWTSDPYDGFRHGLMQEFFFTNSGLEFSEAISAACADPAFSDGADDRPYSGEKCFHAVGHALMYAYEYDLYFSTEQCKTLPKPNEKYWCLVGVFMEGTYLYDARYLPDVPRPDVQGDSLASFCATLEPLSRSVCQAFIGRSYLSAHTSDYKGAFAECSLAGSREAICIRNAARIYIPPLSAVDTTNLARICADISDMEKRTVCVDAIADTIEQGGAGYRQIGLRKEFCKDAQAVLGTTCATAPVEYLHWQELDW